MLNSRQLRVSRYTKPGVSDACDVCIVITIIQWGQSKDTTLIKLNSVGQIARMLLSFKGDKICGFEKSYWREDLK